MISKSLYDVESNHPFNVVLVHEYITKRQQKDIFHLIHATLLSQWYATFSNHKWNF